MNQFECRTSDRVDREGGEEIGRGPTDQQAEEDLRDVQAKPQTVQVGAIDERMEQRGRGDDRGGDCKAFAELLRRVACGVELLERIRALRRMSATRR